MTINTSVDMIAPSTSSTSSSSSSSSTDNGKEFESMLQDQVNSTDSSEVTSDSVTDDSDLQGNPEDSQEGVPAIDTEVTDVQMVLMAALNAQATPIPGIEAVEKMDEAMVAQSETVARTEEVPLMDGEMLDLGDSEVNSQLGNGTGEEVSEEALLLPETEEVFTLEETAEVLEVVDDGEPMVLPEAQSEESEVVTEEVVQVETAETGEQTDFQEENNSETPVETKEPTTTTDGDEPVLLEVEDSGTRVFDKAETTHIKVGENLDTRDPEMDGKLAKIIETANENGDKTVTIQLTPDNLGTLTIQLTQTADGVLQVIFQAADSNAASILGSHAESIAQALAQNGTTVTVETTVQGAQSADDSQADLNQEQENQEQQEQQEQEQDQEQGVVSDDFMQQLRLGLVQFSLDG
ncbi:MAG: flagellar hook-length control protein FliK [Eubacteriales bacterium]